MIPQEEQGLELAKAAAEGAGRESVSKIANVIGGMFPFWGLKKKAVTAYIAEIENSNLPPETKMLAIANAKTTYRHLRNQVSIAQIAQSSAAEGTDFSEKSGVDDQWLDRFMDAAKFVSDEKVQLLWGNILAKEFENPDSTPPSVIRILSEITPIYAKAFQTLCSLMVCITPIDRHNQRCSSLARVILPPEIDYLKKYGLDFTVLNELEMLGLIQFEPSGGYIIKLNSTRFPNLHLIYGNNKVTVSKYPDRELPIGTVLLTRAGLSIARFTDAILVDKHLSEVCTFLKKNSVEVSEISALEAHEQCSP